MDPALGHDFPAGTVHGTPCGNGCGVNFTEYELEGGADGEWKKDPDVGFEIIIDVEFVKGKVKEVRVNGVTLTEDEDYTVTEGSTVITLLPAYLERLGKGTYAIDILFDDGVASATLTIVADDGGLRTDEMIMMLMFVTVMGVVIMPAVIRSRR